MIDLPVPISYGKYKRTVRWKEFTCGWGAALISILMTYPFNKLIFRQMLQGIGFFPAGRQLYNEGFAYLYRGLMPPMMQKTCSTSLLFGFYHQIREPLVDRGFDKYTSKVTASFVSGVLESGLTPFERVLTLMANNQYHTQFKNTIHAFQSIHARFGLREFYRGFVPILIRNSSEAVMFFVAKEELMSMSPEPENAYQNAVHNFFFGAFIGAAMSTIFFPINVAKVRMQSQIGGNYDRIHVVLKKIYEERGRRLGPVYTGAMTNCTKAFMAWGIMNAAYEQLRSHLY